MHLYMNRENQSMGMLHDDLYSFGTSDCFEVILNSSFYNYFILKG